MSAKPDYVVSKLTRPTGGAATGGFVINLTSSTTPMALSQPKDPTLAQYTFFVSRRREDGRERFRLHMGYFETMQAAEEMLAVVREVYPGAWASEAPGKKLRANNPRRRRACPRAARPRRSLPLPPRAARQPRRAPAPLQLRAAAPLPLPRPSPSPGDPRQLPNRIRSRPRRRRPSLKYEHEEPFVLTDDEPEFKPINVPVVHPPAAGS